MLRCAFRFVRCVLYVVCVSSCLKCAVLYDVCVCGSSVCWCVVLCCAVLCCGVLCCVVRCVELRCGAALCVLSPGRLCRAWCGAAVRQRGVVLCVVLYCAWVVLCWLCVALCLLLPRLKCESGTHRAPTVALVVAGYLKCTGLVESVDVFPEGDKANRLDRFMRSEA